MTNPALSRRRSTRGQPIALLSETRSDDKKCILNAPIFYSRPSVASDFPKPVQDAEPGEDANNNPLAGIQTHFYASFTSPGKKKKDKQMIYKVGDVVQIKRELGRHMLGVITSLWSTTEEDSHPLARVHLFLQQKDLPKTMASRDVEKNEIFYSIDNTEIFRLSAIIHRHKVLNANPVNDSDIADSDSDDDFRGHVKWNQLLHWGTSMCRYAIIPFKGLFFKLDWREHHKSRLEIGKKLTTDEEKVEWCAGKLWDIDIRNLPEAKKGKHPKKSKYIDGHDDESGKESLGDATEDEFQVDDDDDAMLEDDEDDLSEGDIDDEDMDSDNPSRKRKRRNVLQTPSKKRHTLARPTPHTKRTLMNQFKQKQNLRSKSKSQSPQKRRARRPPPLEDASTSFLQTLAPDPWLRSLHSLHVAARPDMLPCRRAEYEKVLDSVEELLAEGSGGCIYISGVPGTGKTATVHAVIRELKRMAENRETNPFTYVEINGLKIPEPAAAYSVLWEGLSGADEHLRISAKESLKLLTRHFSAGASSHACIVLMDELDQLVNTKQDVVYNFFNWPTLANSKLIVLAVANTMDLPERVMTGRVRSRLGMVRINFQPYKTPQLEEIVQARLNAAIEGLDDPNPVLSKDAVRLAAMKVSSITGDARRVLDICRRTVELVQPLKKIAGAPDVKEVMNAMQDSPTAAFLKECSLHERIMLAALSKCIKRAGVDEVKWGDVCYQHMLYMAHFPSNDEPSRKPSNTELGRILDSLSATRAMFVEEGTTVSRKAEEDRKVALGLEMGEVERVLGEVGGTHWKSALA